MTLTAAYGFPVVGLTEADCLVKPGFRFSHNKFGIPFRTVAKVGGYVRVGGGYVIPVQFKGGRCALLRSYQRDGSFSFAHVEEVRSNCHNCNMLLRYSVTVPTVIETDDPSVIRLRVTDHDEMEYDPGSFPNSDCMYDLVFKGVVGNSSRQDEAFPHFD